VPSDKELRTIVNCRVRFLSAGFILIASACGCAAQGTVQSWNVSGVKREALVFEPSRFAVSESHPLVFA